MKTILIPALLLMSIIGLPACKTSPRSLPAEQVQAVDDQSIEMRNNTFAFGMFHNLNTRGENLVFSPMSISAALAMTYAGARAQTAEQMSRTLCFDADQERFHPQFHLWLDSIKRMTSDHVSLNLANSIWAHKDFHFVPAFFQLMQQYYDTGLFEVDFKGDRELIRKQINQWVALHTQDLIQDLIAPGVLKQDTRMVLVNAIYFLGQWKKAFDKERTRIEKFYPELTAAIETPFMFREDQFAYYADEQLQLLEIPYDEGHFSMVVFLPAYQEDIHTLIASMTAEKYQNLLSSLENNKVEVWLPSFKMRTRADLEDKLIHMGMPLAFSDRADFSGMSSQNDLKIDKVIHEAFIEVKEEGTEAAAATAVIMIVKSSAVEPPKPKTIFRADRPFFFLIKENIGHSILFAGKVENPALP